MVVAVCCVRRRLVVCGLGVAVGVAVAAGGGVEVHESVLDFDVKLGECGFPGALAAGLPLGGPSWRPWRCPCSCVGACLCFSRNERMINK